MGVALKAIDVRGVEYRYPDGTVALHGIDLSVAPGERVALLGPNGSGKTTLMLHLNGILTPSAGEVRIGGVPVGRSTVAEIRRRVGIVFQDSDDQLFMPNVRDDVAFGPANLGLSGEELEARVSEALRAVDMEHVTDRPPHHLSAGQKRRVALAGVLAMRPEVLVLDEPSTNLDPQARRDFGRLIKRLELTVLLATHDLPYAHQLCTRAILINQGRIVADGPIGEILGDERLLRSHRLELPEGFHLPPR